MGRYLVTFTGFFAFILLLSSCSAAKPVSRSYTSPNASSAHKPTPYSRPQQKPRYISNVAIGSKGGNKINMNVANKPRHAAPKEEEIADNKEVLTSQAAAQQSVEMVSEENEAPQPAKNIKPSAKEKKHKKYKKHEPVPELDLDKEPLVNSVPTNEPNLVVKNPVNIRPSDLSNKTIDDKECKIKYASILGCIPQALINLSLYRFIDEWYGVDYRMGGNDKNGIDCSAFAQRLYNDVFGISLVRTALEQFNYVTIIQDFDKLKEGDLVFFHVHSKRITHVGVYLMNKFFVHASASQGVVISSLNDSYWRKYFAGAGDIIDNYAPMH